MSLLEKIRELNALLTSCCHDNYEADRELMHRYVELLKNLTAARNLPPDCSAGSMCNVIGLSAIELAGRETKSAVYDALITGYNVKSYQYVSSASAALLAVYRALLEDIELRTLALASLAQPTITSPELDELRLLLKNIFAWTPRLFNHIGSLVYGISPFLCDNYAFNFYKAYATNPTQLCTTQSCLDGIAGLALSKAAQRKSENAYLYLQRSLSAFTLASKFRIMMHREQRRLGCANDIISINPLPQTMVDALASMVKEAQSYPESKSNVLVMVAEGLVDRAVVQHNANLMGPANDGTYHKFTSHEDDARVDATLAPL